jgi:AP2-associated kinase
VYLVEDPDTGKQYALKKMNIQEKEQLDNIKKEISYWSKINNHPNIVKLIDYEITKTAAFILMELCTEGNLLDLINSRTEKTLNEKQALYIVSEIASGLLKMHTHSPPIAHRDIKIENILKIGNNYKLCDFGSASIDILDPRKIDKNKLLDNFSKFERMTTFIYRPPEMCDPYSKFPIYEKVDIWMLGCILFALLFQRHPFQDAQKLTITNCQYYIPAEEKNYSEKIIDFMRLLLTPNPVNRPSAADLLNIINNWESIHTIDLPPETQEIKSKHLRNTKTKNMKLLSDDDIQRIQQEIMQGQKKKGKNKYVKSKQINKFQMKKTLMKYLKI